MNFRIRITALATMAAIVATSVPVQAESVRQNNRNNNDQLRFAVSRPGDVNMTCEQLWKEAFLMRSIIAQTRTAQKDSKMRSRGIGVVGTAASYLVGTVTGGLSIAAAGLLASNANNIKNEDAEVIQETAQQRRAMIAGIFTAKECEGPIKDAMVDAPPDNTANVAKISPAAGSAENATSDLAKPRYNQ